MTLPLFNFSQPIIDRDGFPTKPFSDWMRAMQSQGSASATLAAGAVPSSRNVVATGGLHVGGALGDDVGLALYRALTGVSSLPTTGNAEGDLAYALNGRKPGEGAGLGTGVVCFYSTGQWYAVTSGAVVTA